MSDQRDRFLDHVLRNVNNRAILDRASQLQLPDWWLTAGAVFQTVWNVLDGREPAVGIDDYDLFYFDPHDLSSEAQDVVIERAAELFADLDVTVEVCNEARVHLWYEEHFGVPAKAFDSSRDAIDHFASPRAVTPSPKAPRGSWTCMHLTVMTISSTNAYDQTWCWLRVTSTSARRRAGSMSGLV